jgi:hypothetical protein
MRRVQGLLLSFIFLVAMAQVTPVFADETLAVITQRASPIESLSMEELKRVYLRKSLLNDLGDRWIPLNLPVDHQLRQSFSLALFKTSPEEQDQYWNEQYFQGIPPPEVLASEEAVIRFVAITPGAIGYIDKQSLDDRVKVLALLPIP